MRPARTAFAVLVFLLAPAEVCFGHGTHCSWIEGGTAVEAVYHGGEPMAFCDVSVFRPGGEEAPYQTGSTDPRGRFAFVPDTTGTWKVTVDDGMGHSATAEVLVGPEGIRTEGGGRAPDRIRGIIVGISVIFGFFGLFSFLYGKRRRTTPCT
jgi:nickel transport protein